MPDNAGPQQLEFMNLQPDDFKAILNPDASAALDSVPQSKQACDKLTEKKWIFEKRLNYGLEFFKYHAGQRMQMFYYFVVFVGLVVNGYATLYRNGAPGAAAWVAGGGALLSIFFVFLERRNEELVHIAEDVLEQLEDDVLFDGFNREVAWPRRRNIVGWMRGRHHIEARALGIFRRQTADQKPQNQKGDGRSLYEHGKWMPRFQYCIFFMFVAMAILPACKIGIFHAISCRGFGK